MGAITQGVLGGMAIRQQAEEAAQRFQLERERMAQYKENADRQAMIGSIQTLGQILGMPKNLRGPMLDQYGEMMSKTTGKPVSPTLIDILKKADDEQSQSLREMFGQMGLKLNPDQAMRVMGDPFQALKLASEFQQQQMEQERTAQRAQIMGGGSITATRPAPAPRLRMPTPADAPEMSVLPVSPAALPQAAPAPAPAPDVQAGGATDEDAQLAQIDKWEADTLGRMDRLMAMGQGISEGENRGFTAKLKALSERRQAILNAPGITETVVGPDGSPLRVLYTKGGAVKSILGKVPASLDIREGANPATGQPALLAIDKATGRSTVVGRPAPPTQAPLQIERLIALRDRFPVGDPRRQPYEDMIAKETGAAGGAEKASQLATQYQTQSRMFAEVAHHYQNMIAAAPPPGQKATPVGDVTVLYAYFKMLNPTSRMTPDTFADIGSIESIPEQIRTQWKRAVQGGTMTPEFRAQVLQQGSQIYQGHVRRQQQLDATFRASAARAGVNPADVVRPFTVVAPPGGGETPPPGEGGGTPSGPPDASAAMKRLRGYLKK